MRAEEGRDNLVTQSALGDPRLVGLERIRELSGFGFSVEMGRRVLATLVKTLLPLALMALIMLASLYFPSGLVKEKITVAITAALSGAVLLSSINSQLGNVGYVIAIEYGFYIYFVLVPAVHRRGDGCGSPPCGGATADGHGRGAVGALRLSCWGSRPRSLPA